MTPAFIATFERDIAKHELRIIRDDGVNRHLRFQRPGTKCMYFDLITWPGYLCYTGDMGTYVFKRLEDMLQFFRKPENLEPYRIDMRYWAEKVESADRDGVQRFSPERFRAAIREHFDTWSEDERFTAESRAELWGDVQEAVFVTGLDEGDAAAAYRAAADFTYDGRQVFADFWEVNCDEFTHRFMWCCCALQWAIGVYDAAKAGLGVAA